MTSRPDPLHNPLGNVAERLPNVIPFPARNVVSLCKYRVQKRTRGSAKPPSFILGYIRVARESELRARQVDYLIHVGNAVLTRARLACPR